MLHNIFAKPRPFVEYSVFAIGIIAAVIVWRLQPYSSFQRPLLERLPERDRVVDSVKARWGLTPDSTFVYAKTEYDKHLAHYLADSLGAYNARQYLTQNDVLELREVVSISERTSDFVLAIGGSTTESKRPLERFHKFSSLDSAHKLKAPRFMHLLVFSKHGRLIGASDIVRAESLFLSSRLPTSSTASVSLESLWSDSAAVITALQRFLPPQMEQRLRNATPTSIIRENDVYTVRYRLEALGAMERSLVLSAEQVHAKLRLIAVSWEERVSLSGWQEPQSQAWITVLKIIGVGLIIILAVVLGVAFFVRLSKRAASITPAILVGCMMTVWLMLSDIAERAETWYVAVLMALLILVFSGFLVWGLPIAGLLSIAREIFAEKFYTLKNLWSVLRAEVQALLEKAFHRYRRTFNVQVSQVSSAQANEARLSPYLGRSLLYGTVAGMLYGAYSLAFAAVATTTNWLPTGKTLLFQREYYEFLLTAKSGLTMGIGLGMFFPCFLFVQLLVVPTLGAWLLRKRLRARWSRGC
jgi:hypothetical protein